MPKERAPSVVWVADVLVSEAIARKISDKHGLDPHEIASLAASPPPKVGRFVRDKRGTRLYLKVRTAARQGVLVVLYPAGDDVWRLASAYVQTRGRGA